MRYPPGFRQIIPLILLPLALLACTGDAADSADPQPDGDEAQAASVLPTIDPAMFDSIVWGAARDAIDRGATVYAYSCVKCHGDSGAGDGGYRLQGRVLRPPSFLVADWRFADDPVGLRQAIYSGSGRGMPHWGLAGLAPRDVDAVARYVTRLWAEAD